MTFCRVSVRGQVSATMMRPMNKICGVVCSLRIELLSVPERAECSSSSVNENLASGVVGHHQQQQQWRRFQWALTLIGCVMAVVSGGGGGGVQRWQ